jgi:hypothetical protein
MNPRPYAWLVGGALLLIGLAGFVPDLTVAESDPLRVAAGVGDPQLLGLLPVSPLLNVIHIGLGGWGLFAGRGLGRSVLYARRMALAAAALTLCGLVPGPDTLWGAAPLYGNNLLLHGLLAVTGALFGFLYRKLPAIPSAGGAAPSTDWSEDD